MTPGQPLGASVDASVRQFSHPTHDHSAIRRFWHAMRVNGWPKPRQMGDEACLAVIWHATGANQRLKPRGLGSVTLFLGLGQPFVAVRSPVGTRRVPATGDLRVGRLLRPGRCVSSSSEAPQPVAPHLLVELDLVGAQPDLPDRDVSAGPVINRVERDD